MSVENWGASNDQNGSFLAGDWLGISMEMHGNRKLGFHEDISHAGHTHVSDEALNSLKILKLLRDCLHGKWKDISAATLVDIFRISRPNWCVLKSCYGMLWSC